MKALRYVGDQWFQEVKGELIFLIQGQVHKQSWNRGRAGSYKAL